MTLASCAGAMTFNPDATDLRPCPPPARLSGEVLERHGSFAGPGLRQ